MLSQPEEHVQGAGPPEQDPLHAAHICPLPVRVAHPGARHRLRGGQAAAERSRRRGGVLGFLNLFSGGALTQFAVFALGIMPYITSSIIMQILAVVIPKLEEWQEPGRGRPAQDHPVDPLPHHRHRPAAGDGLTFLFHNGGGGLLGGRAPAPGARPPPRLPGVPGLLVVLTLTAGTACSCGWASSSPSGASATACRPHLRLGRVPHCRTRARSS